MSFGPSMASSRLRADIPQRELEKFGIRRGKDILVYGKHIIQTNQTGAFRKKIYDVCDDHYSDSLADYYLEHTERADLVTCNSEAMKSIIGRTTGRNARVIPDPYESDERPAGMGAGLFWFGHQSNLKTLEPYQDLKIKTLTGDEWSRIKQLQELERCALVVLPTDNRQAKSANRLIETVRNGRFCVCGPLPAYDEFKDFMWVGDIREGIEWALSHKPEVIERIKACQDYIKEKYSPSTIAKQWLSALEEVWR